MFLGFFILTTNDSSINGETNTQKIIPGNRGYSPKTQEILTNGLNSKRQTKEATKWVTFKSELA